ncbi:LPS assembly lipoprotein LptE [Francisella adeliensis]|uniref:LPS-assembly lipoprotein LptE n=1 Tax=Francisella adeliensis TaxID=2007306 RepID=A0A2Z4XZ03_9GAMM|nr:LPS assembly lipoprotein LptE [Francisella adeliensis]AXA33878.1 hypothetical protein CDH04_05345 [Francisella adeliensis]MBK2085780.1 hypothetical protein [Francisella adeliensis]MBK2097658.1 hypothetical protein [Francisella adeliensis]QIW12115.1 hypothetical protein FZC43_05350 [Francisella adeliensis]QIW13989.1 hypothetical protein FZC44_05350 [Francisella adeliensis]
MKLSINKYIFVMFFALIITACGFHARGVGNVGSFSNFRGMKICIKSNNFSNYARELQRNLVAYKAIIVEDDEDADYIINLQSVVKDNKLISVVGGASNNNYQLILRMSYNVVKPNVEDPIIPNKTLETRQFWQSNSGIVLSQASEANRQYVYLQTQLINNMLQQIAILLPKVDNQNTDDSEQDTE